MKTHKTKHNRMKLISSLGCLTGLVSLSAAFANPSEPQTTPPQPPPSPEVAKEMAGADERTPSLSQYFSWINNTNEGSTEKQTLINMEFFQWLHDKYGMKLDIYAWDAGNLDGAFNVYCDPDSDMFKEKFPRGWKPIAEAAKGFGGRLGAWGGPDGFGNTPEEEKRRLDFMVSLCRDLNFALFKFDQVCGGLRPAKEDAFVEMMIECRKHSPDLIVLNHRLNLGKGLPYVTTALWERKETYIDTLMWNTMTAPHNRAEAVSRGLPDGLGRLLEDHGVCISSCIDYWDDDLILQAFNRGMILAPQVYGSPWFLRDDEYPRLARIYNFHRRFRDILVDGMVLPENKFGPLAVSRGDDQTRVITLRNLSWEPKQVTIPLDETIGLRSDGDREVRLFHPYEQQLGSHAKGQAVEVEVLPYRATMVVVSTRKLEEPAIVGTPFHLVRDIPDRPVVFTLLGEPGSSASIFPLPEGGFASATLDGKSIPLPTKEKPLKVDFAGKPISGPWHQFLGDLEKAPVPADVEYLYETASFTPSNDALEVRSIERSGPTAIPQVAAAREAFFDQEYFRARGCWDRFLFDGRDDTFFGVYVRDADARLGGGVFRLDMQKPTDLEKMEIRYVTDGTEKGEDRELWQAEVSSDLKSWQPVTFRRSIPDVPPAMVGLVQKKGKGLVLWKPFQVAALTSEGSIPKGVRYLRMPAAPGRPSEVRAWSPSGELDRNDWQVTTLFAPFERSKPQEVWSKKIMIDPNAAQGSYLCVAVEGEFGSELARAVLRTPEGVVGAKERAPSFPGNAWEAPIAKTKGNHTFYFPITDDLRGKEVEVSCLMLRSAKSPERVHVWQTCYPIPMAQRTLELVRKR